MSVRDCLGFAAGLAFGLDNPESRTAVRFDNRPSPASQPRRKPLAAGEVKLPCLSGLVSLTPPLRSAFSPPPPLRFGNDLAYNSRRPLETRAPPAHILRSSTIVYACLGLLFVGCAIGMYNQKSHTGHPAWLQKMGELCFAVYLLQEFILLGLYQHTPLPQIAGTYWLPWVGFLITMAVALPMVWLMRSTRIGQRYL